MLTAAAFASAAVLLAASIPNTDAHGYMLIPESQFKGSANSAWIVQIDPVWASEDWDGNKPGSVDAFKALKTANNFKDLKTLMDDTSVYGADCGFTDPNGTPQPIPTDGKATFSRAIVHVGPCEIWLDDTKVLYEDDCFTLTASIRGYLARIEYQLDVRKSNKDNIVLIMDYAQNLTLPHVPDVPSS
ncbi:hypothetical protein PPTG_20376 [Phytophthora nicotianae INRA-310]|uniref:Uncharacterized protein n=2 Tax=Phytophthora nicotianae TaxID=4792 RepID=W2P9R8_PHYN3|nr:hypothetical protein PPTG_20376 [Phytophthora nicotianae INRA-310]ETM97400.1 hypothetical protein PPTG_20376 [Phytophthora nicotianae INRA-310]